MKKANDAMNEANAKIETHNQLIEQAHRQYGEVEKKIGAGEISSTEARARVQEIQAKVQEARRKLAGARDSLGRVQSLDVAPPVKRYARLLSKATGIQLDAEAKEIAYYGILEKDPTLSKNRKQAKDLLSSANQGYAQAGKLYGRARKLAASNPKLISTPASGGTATSR